MALGLLMWCAAGVGYAASIALDRLRAPVAGCIVLMIWVTTSGYDPSLNLWDSWGLAAAVPSLSPDRWYLELMYISTIRQVRPPEQQQHPNPSPSPSPSPSLNLALT